MHGSVAIAGHVAIVGLNVHVLEHTEPVGLEKEPERHELLVEPVLHHCGEERRDKPTRRGGE
jgi:hypothetical protein